MLDHRQETSPTEYEIVDISKFAPHRKAIGASQTPDQKIEAMCKQLEAMGRTLNWIFVGFVLLVLLI
jgi:hypothetical protein